MVWLVDGLWWVVEGVGRSGRRGRGRWFLGWPVIAGVGEAGVGCLSVGEAWSLFLAGGEEGVACWMVPVRLNWFAGC